MHQKVPFLRSVLTFGLVLAYLLSGTVADVRTQQFHKEPVNPTTAIKSLKRSEILQILTERIDVSEVQGPRQLKQFLDWIQKKVETKRGVKLPFFVTTEGFRMEDPDAPPTIEASVKLPETQQSMTVGEALGIVLSQVPTRNAAFLIRKGRLEITTDKTLFAEFQFQEKLLASFTNRTLGEVIEEFREQTGLLIIVDPRINNKLATPITASFTNNVSLKVALTLVTNMADVDFIVFPRVVYITTAENVQKLRPVQKKLFESSEPSPDYEGPMIPGLPGA